MGSPYQKETQPYDRISLMIMNFVVEDASD
jgi:hypothetical protein